MTPQTLNPAQISQLELSPDSYIYKIVSTAPRADPLKYQQADQLAIISSDDSLCFLDPATLRTMPDGIIKQVNDKVTCLERGNDLSSNLVATAGRDGLVRYWDKRSKEKAAEIHSREQTLCMATNQDTNHIYSAQTDLVPHLRQPEELPRGRN